MRKNGQSAMEYILLVGIVTTALMIMGTDLKRGIQSVVKVTADQVGNQQNADQDFSHVQEGYMVGSNTEIQEIKNDKTAEIGYVTNTGFSESSSMMTNTISKGGFTPGSH